MIPTRNNFMFKLLWLLRYEKSQHVTKADDGYWRIKTNKVAFELGTSSHFVVKALAKAKELGYISDLRIRHGRVLFKWVE